MVYLRDGEDAVATYNRLFTHPLTVFPSSVHPRDRARATAIGEGLLDVNMLWLASSMGTGHALHVALSMVAIAFGVPADQCVVRGSIRDGDETLTRSSAMVSIIIGGRNNSTCLANLKSSGCLNTPNIVYGRTAIIVRDADRMSTAHIDDIITTVRTGGARYAVFIMVQGCRMCTPNSDGTSVGSVLRLREHRPSVFYDIHAAQQNALCTWSHGLVDAIMMPGITAHALTTRVGVEYARMLDMGVTEMHVPLKAIARTLLARCNESGAHTHDTVCRVMRAVCDADVMVKSSTHLYELTVLEQLIHRLHDSIMGTRRRHSPGSSSSSPPDRASTKKV